MMHMIICTGGSKMKKTISTWIVFLFFVLDLIYLHKKRSKERENIYFNRYIYCDRYDILAKKEVEWKRKDLHFKKYRFFFYQIQKGTTPQCTKDPFRISYQTSFTKWKYKFRIKRFLVMCSHQWWDRFGLSFLKSLSVPVRFGSV